MSTKGIISMSKTLKLLSVLVMISLLTISITNVSAVDNSEAEEILLISAYDGDLNKVKDLLSKGIDVNAKG